jgi:AcrR family transcriptional regulator
MNKSESKYYNTALLMDQALLLLLEKKEYDFITVKEVCEKAGVNRSTFYLHYETMDDLLKECIELINKRFLSAFDNITIDPNKLGKDDLFFITDKYLIPYLELIKKNKKIYKLIHNKPHIFNNQKAFNVLYKNIFEVILEKYGVSDEEKPYVFAYFTNGSLAIIDKWIENDCKDDMYKIIEITKNVIGYKI